MFYQGYSNKKEVHSCKSAKIAFKRNRKLLFITYCWCNVSFILGFFVSFSMSHIGKLIAI